MRNSLLIFIIFLSNIVLSQNNLDSLLSLLNSTNNNDEKIILFEEIVAEASEISYDSAIFYQQQSIDYALKETRDNSNIARMFLDLGKLNLYNGTYQKAVETYKEALEFAKKTNDKKIQSLCIHSIGNAYLYKSEHSSALEYYLEALEMREEIKDTVGIAATTNNIGLIYWNLKNYDKALFYYKLSLENEKKAQNELGMASSYNNIGLAFWKKEQLDSAIFYIKKTLIIREKSDTKTKIASTYNNLGVLYRAITQYDSALFYFDKSLSLYKESRIKYDIANTYNNISSTLLYLGNFKGSRKYIDSSLSVCLPAHEKALIRDAYDIIAVIFNNTKQYDSAYYYLRLHMEYKDSIFDEDFTNAIADMETKYESDKKQKAIELQNLELEKKDTEISARKKTQTILVSFIIVVMLLMVFLVRLFLQKKKANDLLQIKNAEISQQKEEIETQANNLQQTMEELKIVNEELLVQKEQIAIQNELLTEKNEFVESSIKYASSIQNASLPLDEEISKYFDNWIIFYPKDIVSGDFYLFSEEKSLKTGKNNLFFIVSDCTGHGVPGAFMSMIGIRLLTKYINERNIESPAEILTLLSEDIFKALKQDTTNNTDGMDLAVCKFSNYEENDTFDLTFAGAKRNIFYYSKKENEIIKITGTRKSIGGINPRNKEKFIDRELKLSKEDIIYTYTDGIVDQNNPKRKRYGTKKLLRTLYENVEKTFDVQKFELEKELSIWQNDSTQRDDITFVALRMK